MNINELAERTGQAKRNIRFLIAEGIVPEPYSKGRGASYGPEHLAALSVYSGMREQGVSSLELIRERIRSQSGPPPLSVVTPSGVKVEIEVSLLRRLGAEALAKETRNAVLKAVREWKGNEDEACDGEG